MQRNFRVTPKSGIELRCIFDTATKIVRFDINEGLFHSAQPGTLLFYRTIQFQEIFLSFWGAFSVHSCSAHVEFLHLATIAAIRWWCLEWVYRTKGDQGSNRSVHICANFDLFRSTPKIQQLATEYSFQHCEYNVEYKTVVGITLFLNSTLTFPPKDPTWNLVAALHWIVSR